MPNSDAPTISPLQKIYHLAFAQHRAGRLLEAARLYQIVLKALPNQPDTNYSYGLLAIQLNNPVAAVNLFKTALEADPSPRHYWISYIETLLKVDRTDLAQQALTLGQQRGLQGADVDALAARLAEQTSAKPAVKSVEHKSAKSSKKSTHHKKR